MKTPKENVEVEVAQLGERVRSMKEFFIELQESNHQRHDSHGKLMREGFDKLFSKIDIVTESKQRDLKEIEQRLDSIDTRLVTIEAQRHSASSIFTKAIAFIGGASGIYALVERMKQP